MVLDTVITIVNYDRHMFIVQATDFHVNAQTTRSFSSLLIHFKDPVALICLSTDLYIEALF